MSICFSDSPPSLQCYCTVPCLVFDMEIYYDDDDDDDDDRHI